MTSMPLSHCSLLLDALIGWLVGSPTNPSFQLPTPVSVRLTPQSFRSPDYNHAFFWTEMAPPDQAKKTKPSAQLQGLIDKSFGSVEKLQEAFNARAAPGALFGSGWVWVCVNKKGDELKLVGTPNQDNPLMKGAADEIMFPILGLDVRVYTTRGVATRESAADYPNPTFAERSHNASCPCVHFAIINHRF